MPDAFYRLLAFPNGIAMIGLGYSLWRVARPSRPPPGPRRSTPAHPPRRQSCSEPSWPRRRRALPAPVLHR